MCGIFAAATRKGIAAERITAALKALEHESGPDGSGTWTSSDRRWTLGHTRLSIIGLNNGQQPMTSPTAPFTSSSTVSSTATARFAINCEQLVANSPRKAIAKSRCIFTNNVGCRR